MIDFPNTAETCCVVSVAFVLGLLFVLFEFNDAPIDDNVALELVFVVLLLSFEFAASRSIAVGRCCELFEFELTVVGTIKCVAGEEAGDEEAEFFVELLLEFELILLLLFLVGRSLRRASTGAAGTFGPRMLIAVDGDDDDGVVNDNEPKRMKKINK